MYCPELQRVATTTGSAANVTDTITFDGYTDTTITNGTTTDVTKYYSVQGKNVAMVNSQGWFTLVPDMQSGNTLVINSNGSIRSVQLFAPYGSVRYSDGTSPTAHNYTGQRLDGTTGLLYYNARYYDPISGRFTSTDTVETNANGSDPYAYVYDNPTTFTDPSGQFGWALGGLLAIGEAIPGVDVIVTAVLVVAVVVVVAALIIQHVTSRPAAPDLNATYTTSTSVPLPYSGGYPSNPGFSPSGGGNTGGGYTGGGYTGGGYTGGGYTGGGYTGGGYANGGSWTGWIPQSLPLPKVVIPPPPPPPVTWGSDSSGAEINGALHPPVTSIATKTSNPADHILSSTIKKTDDGQTIRVRKLSPGEVKKLTTPWGSSFHDAKQKEYDATDDIYVDKEGNYWIGPRGSDYVTSFP